MKKKNGNKEKEQEKKNKFLLKDLLIDNLIWLKILYLLRIIYIIDVNQIKENQSNNELNQKKGIQVQDLEVNEK